MKKTEKEEKLLKLEICGKLLLMHKF